MFVTLTIVIKVVGWTPAIVVQQLRHERMVMVRSKVLLYLHINFCINRLSIESGYVGSGCGEVGRAVASGTRNYGFESSLSFKLVGEVNFED